MFESVGGIQSEFGRPRIKRLGEFHSLAGGIAEIGFLSFFYTFIEIIFDWDLPGFS